MSEGLDLLVVGGGPAGLAALAEAAREGLLAVALEADDHPAGAIHRTMEGLVVLSDASHYEVDGLPLDCRDPGETTREELLHYYARVIQHRRLRVRCRTRVVGLSPNEAGVEVIAETPQGMQRLQARQVLVTAWYRRRPVPSAYVDATGSVPTLAGLRSASEVAAHRVVVIGGGYSAYEQAVALMLYGHRVTVLSRHPVRWPAAHVGRLLEATGSSIVEGAVVRRVEADGVHYTHNGEDLCTAAGAVVACLGMEPSPDILAMLASISVLDPRELAEVARARSPDQLVRRGTAAQEALAESLGMWPDLSRQLFDGVRGIRVAGGALHVGGADAGVAVSIHTARLAVGAIVGRPRPELHGPLPRALHDHAMTSVPHDDVETWAHLRPLLVRSWTRTAMVETAEGRVAGVSDARPEPSLGKYLRAMSPEKPGVKTLLEACDGSRTVDELARHVGAEGATKRELLVAALRTLMRHGALSWLPTRDDATSRR